MEKSKGRSHYFKGTDLYYIKSVLDYIRKNNPKLSIPNCWKEGGSLNEKVKTDYGILPSWTNGIEGRGHREKYTGTDMYKIADHLIQDLKEGNIQRRQSRSLTPIEQLASGENNNETLGIQSPSEVHEKLMSEPYTPAPEYERELQKFADELCNMFREFVNKVFEAYKAST